MQTIVTFLAFLLEHAEVAAFDLLQETSATFKLFMESGTYRIKFLQIFWPKPIYLQLQGINWWASRSLQFQHGVSVPRHWYREAAGDSARRGRAAPCWTWMVLASSSWLHSSPAAGHRWACRWSYLRNTWAKQCQAVRREEESAKQPHEQQSPGMRRWWWCWGSSCFLPSPVEEGEWEPLGAGLAAGHGQPTMVLKKLCNITRLHCQ